MRDERDLKALVPRPKYAHESDPGGNVYWPSHQPYIDQETAAFNRNLFISGKKAAGRAECPAPPNIAKAGD